MSELITIQFSGNDNEVLQKFAKLNDLIIGPVSGGSAPGAPGAAGFIGGGGGGGGTGGSPVFNIPSSSGLDTSALCQHYQSIRPVLVSLLPVIELIPVYGRTLGGAIRILMQIADGFCGTGS